MSALFKLFLILSILILQGCQLLNSSRPPTKEKVIETGEQHDQVHYLLRLGNQYSKLSKEGQQQACKQLIIDHKVQGDWQSAWLIVYLLNNNFNCLTQTESLQFLKTIELNKNVAVPLKWLNRNQINLLNDLISSQNKKNSFKRKNNNLKTELNNVKIQLEQAEIQLKEVISKIQALKIIETTINQKTE